MYTYVYIIVTEKSFYWFCKFKYGHHLGISEVLYKIFLTNLYVQIPT